MGFGANLRSSVCLRNLFNSIETRDSFLRLRVKAAQLKTTLCIFKVIARYRKNNKLYLKVASAPSVLKI